MEVDATERFLNPGTKEVKAASVATSKKYPVAPFDADQFAVKLVWAINVAAFAVGIDRLTDCLLQAINKARIAMVVIFAFISIVLLKFNSS